MTDQRPTPRPSRSSSRPEEPAMNRHRLPVLPCSPRPTVLVPLRGAHDADAIPAFARKYQLSCSTCHAPFPRLKPFGEEFAARGFRMEDPAQEPTRATYDVGDPMLKLFRELPAGRAPGRLRLLRAGRGGRGRLRVALVRSSSSPAGRSPSKMSYYFYAILEKGERSSSRTPSLQFNERLRAAGGPDDRASSRSPTRCSSASCASSATTTPSSRPGSVICPPTSPTTGASSLTWHAPAEVDVIGQLVNGNGIERR